MGAAFSKASPFVEDLSQLSNKQFDYIIVGGGTAGCVLANRLSKDPNTSVLLLEAGKSHQNVLFSKIPLAFPKLFKTENDWNLETVPQSTLNDRKLYWPRGKLLGGSSSINALMYHHCSPGDFDQWTSICSTKSNGSNEPVWSYDALRPYLNKAEHFNPPAGLARQQSKGSANGQTTSGTSSRLTLDYDTHDDVNLDLRGDSGPWQTRYGPFNQVCQDGVRACEKVGINYVPDVNTPKGTLGTSMVVGFVDSHGSRSSAATAYLTPEALARDNLTVAIGCLVTKLIFEGTNNAEPSQSPKVVSVEITRADGSAKDAKYSLKSKKEVILSAGSIATPQLLLLSGIGPVKDLQSLGIPVVKDSPHVGANLIDHLMTTLAFRAAPGTSLAYLDSPLNGLFALAKWLVAGQGIYGAIAPQGFAFVRSDDKRLPFDSSASTSSTLHTDDETSSASSPDIELIWLATAYIDHGLTPPPKGAEVFSMAACSLKPQSRGTIKLKSTDPFDKPLIDPNYLSTESDVNVLVKSIRLMLRIARTEPLSSKLIPQLDNTDTSAGNVFWPGDAKDVDKLTDEDLKVYLKRNCETIYHPVGTARMGADPSTSVVSPSLLAHGISNLRIVDASIFPTQLSGHPTASVIAIAERAAEIILS